MNTTPSLEQLQLETNQQMYDDLITYLHSLETYVDKQQSFNIIVSAMATNLGAILAQIPDKYREDFIKITNEIINASMTETMKTVDNINWGQIGHA